MRVDCEDVRQQSGKNDRKIHNKNSTHLQPKRLPVQQERKDEHDMLSF